MTLTIDVRTTTSHTVTRRTVWAASNGSYTLSMTLARGTTRTVWTLPASSLGAAGKSRVLTLTR